MAEKTEDLAMEGFKEHRWTHEEIGRFWDFESTREHNYYSLKHGRAIYKLVQPYIKNDLMAIDYGCGQGHMLSILSQYFKGVGGLEFSPESVKNVEDSLKHLNNFIGAKLVGDIHEQLGVSGDISLLTCIEVIEHMYDEDLEMCLDNILARLNNDSVAIFTTPNDEDRSNSMIMDPSTGELFHRWQHVRSFSKTSLKSKLESKGFEVLAVLETDFRVPNSGPLILLAKLFRKLTGKSAKQPNLVAIAKKR